MWFRSTGNFGRICTRVVGLGLVAWAIQPAQTRAEAQSPATKEQADGKTSGPDQDRQKALALSYDHKDLEVLPMLEALAKAHPEDREVQERLAVSLVTKSATVGTDEGKAVRLRARSILNELKKSGPLSDLGEVLAELIPDGGGSQTFSTKSEAQTAMKDGEAAFARRDFPAARRLYQRALTLEPSLYFAALFVGDTYFAEDQLDQAQTWFARASLIDPNKESAHRYLGDAQNKAGQADTPRLSYLDAVLAEPYTRRPWLALRQWAKSHGVMVSHPRIVPEELETSRDGEKSQKADTPDDGRSQWHRYAETRAAWAGGRFKATFPKESDYRHSLAEESDALRQVARAIAADVKAGRIKEPHPCFASLVKLDEEGLLEAYVLYARPDDGIAQDYESYRSTHRDVLRRYLRQYVAPARDTNVAPQARGLNPTKTRRIAD